LSDLADYLSVDRSAMMREIKKMNEEKYYNLRKAKNHSH
ncbi:Crp/Fnr family transcriptional regulator, partial [Ruminococcus sp. AF43-11]